MIQNFREEALKTIPVLKAGYMVRVHQKIKDVSPDGKEKERVQVFEGQVIATKGGKAMNGTVTVRKISSGVGVERIFPIHSPNIEKIEVERESEAMKARLYYLRRRTGKAAVAIKEKDRAAEIHAQHEAEKAARAAKAAAPAVTEPAKV